MRYEWYGGGGSASSLGRVPTPGHLERPHIEKNFWPYLSVALRRLENHWWWWWCVYRGSLFSVVLMVLITSQFKSSKRWRHWFGIISTGFQQHKESDSRSCFSFQSASNHNEGPSHLQWTLRTGYYSTWDVEILRSGRSVLHHVDHQTTSRHPCRSADILAAGRDGVDEYAWGYTCSVSCDPEHWVATVHSGICLTETRNQNYSGTDFWTALRAPEKPLKGALTNRRFKYINTYIHT